MAKEDQVPEWARELAESIVSTMGLSEETSMDCEQSGPEETEWGVDLVKISPAVMEIQEAGPNDGELVIGAVHRFDILAAQKIFDEVDAFTFGYEIDGRPKITIEGQFKGRAVVTLIYLEPLLNDDEDTD